MVRIGIVGVGFMGMIHYLAARKLKGAPVTAICSRDPKKLAGDWRGIRGNFGPPGEHDGPVAASRRYDRLDDLLADPDIDLVDVCNPTAPARRRRPSRPCRPASTSWSRRPSPWSPKDADAMVSGGARRRASC